MFAEVVSSLGSYLLPFLLVLTVVVFIHELGHFLVGRWCGIKVDAFSIGFGPELFHHIDKHGTRWRLAALPLGGYVKFHGDANGASMSDEASIEAMPQDERDVTFAGQPVWKRFLTVAAGPAANFVLALVVFAGLFMIIGRPIVTPRVDGVRAGGAAAVAGFEQGDVVVEIDGQAIDSFESLQRIVMTSPGVDLHFVVDRAGKLVRMTAQPAVVNEDTALGPVRKGVLGIESKAQDFHIQKYGPVDAVRLGAHETWFIVRQTVNGIAGVLTGRESTKTLSGPAGLAQVSGEMAKHGPSALLNLIAILSISIGLLNLAPIPLLDGGHLLFYVFEAIRGRALPQRAQEFGFRIGIAVVGGLMLLATFNDVTRLGPQILQWIQRG
ncbi:MAG: RIP metalloprotease [Hyphomicrobiales bacterium]|nr:RIP metalloprotease [Hyphomicrobiales bacterium]